MKIIAGFASACLAGALLVSTVGCGDWGGGCGGCGEAPPQVAAKPVPDAELELKPFEQDGVKFIPEIQKIERNGKQVHVLLLHLTGDGKGSLPLTFLHRGVAAKALDEGAAGSFLVKNWEKSVAFDTAVSRMIELETVPDLTVNRVKGQTGYEISLTFRSEDKFHPLMNWKNW